MAAQRSEETVKKKPGIIMKVSELFSRNRAPEESSIPQSKEKIEWLSYTSVQKKALKEKGDLPETPVYVHGISKDDKYYLISVEPKGEKFKVKASEIK